MNHDIDPDFHELNKDRLDEEWANQPRLYRAYADKLARAERDLSRAEAQLKVMRADTELNIRDDPAKYGLGKLVEAAVKAAVEVHKDVRAAGDDVVKAKYRVDLLKAATRTLEHRKAALQDLVQLRLADYFAAPKAKGAAGRDTANRQIDRAFGSKRKVSDA